MADAVSHQLRGWWESDSSPSLWLLIYLLLVWGALWGSLVWSWDSGSRPLWLWHRGCTQLPGLSRQVSSPTSKMAAAPWPCFHPASWPQIRWVLRAQLHTRLATAEENTHIHHHILVSLQYISYSFNTTWSLNVLVKRTDTCITLTTVNTTNTTVCKLLNIPRTSQHNVIYIATYFTVS